MLDSGEVVDSAILPDGAVREHSVTLDAEDLIESIRTTSQSPSASSRGLGDDSASEKSAARLRGEPIRFHPVVVTNTESSQGLSGLEGG